ncbi:MAG: hypothetical protein AAF560_21750 [Acidobacteriota bacterium]
MFMVYLLWLTIVFGGFFLGGGAAWTLMEQGFDPALGLMAVLYLGCAFYGLPRLFKLVTGRS